MAAEPMMEELFTPSPSRQLSKNIQDIADSIGRMRREAVDSGLPVTEDSEALQRFCVKLEHIVQVGLRARGGLFGRRREFWQYASSCLAGNKNLNSAIAFVQSMSELRTSVGKARAFIRFCLMQQCLADSLQQCECCRKLTNDWFDGYSIWRNRALFASLVSVLYDLNEVPFDLSPQGYDLDAAWPTFSRKTFSNALHGWQPPSRSLSISSFENTFSSLADVDTSIPERPLADSSYASEMAGGAQSVEELSKAVALAERLVEEYKTEKTDLQAQLQAKSDLWTEKESAMQDQLAGYKNIVDKLRVRSAARVAGAPEPAEEDELSLQAEYSAALEAELESLQRDVKAKKSVDDKKTRLIEQLDARVGNLERRLTALLTLLETCCRGSDAKTAKLMTAAKTVEQLIAALDDSEHLRVKLKSANGELTTMLHAVEEKGMKIGQMAKLKLTKYAAENRRLKAALGEREGEEGEKGETKGEAEASADRPTGQSDERKASAVETDDRNRDATYDRDVDLSPPPVDDVAPFSPPEVARSCGTQTEDARATERDAAVVTRLRDAAGRLEAELRERDALHADVASERDRLAARAADLDADLRVRQGRLEDARRDVDERASRIADSVTATLSADVRRLTTEVASMREVAAMRQRELAATRTMCDQEVSSLRFQHSSDRMTYSQTLKNYASQQDDLCGLLEKVAQQDVVVETLEAELRQLRGEHLAETETRRSESSDLRVELQIKTEESDSLTSLLEEFKQSLLEKEQAVTSVKTEYSQQKVEDERVSTELTQQLHTLTMDNTQLKKRLIVLIRQKDVLWQRTDLLEFERRRRSEAWVQDDLALACPRCHAEFSFLLRKHHCRVCGQIFCHDCSAHWVMTPHSSAKERVCDGCFLEMSHTELPPGGAADDDVDDDDDDDEELPKRRSDKWAQLPDLSSESSSDDNPSLVEVDPVFGEEGREEGGTIEEPPSTAEPASTTTASDDITRVTTRDSSVSPVKHSSPSTELDVNSELFDMITDEEIAQSLVDSTSAVRREEAPLSAEWLSESGPYEVDVCVAAGRRHSVDVIIRRPKTRLFWQFTTEQKGINFSACFRELDNATPGGSTELIATCKCASHKQVVGGDLEANQPGVYTLVFDNVYSRLTSKTLHYTLSTILPPDDTE